MFTMGDTNLSSVVEAAIINHALCGEYDCFYGDSVPQHPIEVKDVSYNIDGKIRFTVVRADGLEIHTNLPDDDVVELNESGWL